MPPAGVLRDRVTFQSASYTDDGGGGGTKTWSDLFCPVWGQVVEQRGRESLEAGRTEASHSALLRVRSSSQTRTVTPEHRAVIDGVAYQVRSISNPDRRNKWLEMIIQRGVAV